MIICNLITNYPVMRQSNGEALLNEQLPVMHLAGDAVITAFSGGGRPPLCRGKSNVLSHSAIRPLRPLAQRCFLHD